MTAHLTVVPATTVSPECGPVPRAPGDTPLFYAKHLGGGQVIITTSHGAAPDPVADGWHLIGIEAKP